MKMLDLFCGRWGWSKAFAARGWDCVGIDLVEPPDVPDGCTFLQIDILAISRIAGWMLDWDFDFICASSPCEQFSVHGLKCFYPNPPYPERGMRLFNHIRALCEASGLPYAMENVRASQAFVGNAVNHCGPFYLWGSGVPILMPQGILKGRRLKTGGYKRQTAGKTDAAAASLIATIPPELSHCIAGYADRLLKGTA